MARPTKQGPEYFPMDVDADTDEKVEYLTAKCGFIAFGVYVHLLMKIYKNGYFMEWSDRTLYVTAKRLAIPADDLKKIIDGCIEAELFDAEIFEKFSVLTSQSIQKRYLAATEKRKGASIGQYSLLEVNSEKTTVNSEKTEVNSEKTTVNSGKSTQSKVKESKVNNNTNTNTVSCEMTKEEAEAISLYEQVLGVPIRNTTEVDMLLDLINTYGAENVKAAMKEAFKSGLRARNLRYIEGCLKKWASGETRASPSRAQTAEEKARKEEENKRRNEAAMAAYRAKVEARYGGVENGDGTAERSAS